MNLNLKLVKCHKCNKQKLFKDCELVRDTSITNNIKFIYMCNVCIIGGQDDTKK